jgi:hypothetical protein
MRSTRQCGWDFVGYRLRNGWRNIRRCRTRISFGSLTATVSPFCWAGQRISPTTSDKLSSRSRNRRSAESGRLDAEQNFGPISVQFKGEINDALPRKRRQKRHLEFCIAHLLSRESGDNPVESDVKPTHLPREQEPYRLEIINKDNAQIQHPTSLTFIDCSHVWRTPHLGDEVREQRRVIVLPPHERQRQRHVQVHYG